MVTQITEYRGIIVIESDYKTEGLINDPLQTGQLGFIVQADKIKFSQGAIDCLKKVQKSRDAIGEVMCDNNGPDNTVLFSWLAGPKRFIEPGKHKADRDYNPSLLTACTEELVTDPEAVKIIDSYLDREP